MNDKGRFITLEEAFEDVFTADFKQATPLPICQAADEVIDLFESLGFTSNIKPDVEFLRHSIVEIIERNTNDKET